jgi:uridine kinase
LKDNLSDLLDIVLNIDKSTRFILGIDGLSRSGKTTLVKKLKVILKEKRINVCVFHMDDFIVERKKRYNTGNDEWIEYYYLQWDIQWLKENFFIKLRESNQITLPFYDGELDTHTIQNVTLPDTCMIIIEGVFLQRREWRTSFDFVVYLDCPRNIRFLRESNSTQRDIEKFRKRYWKAEDYYLENEIPEKQANFVLKS